jgi:hypothetical protein
VPFGWVAITLEPVSKPSELWQFLARQSNAKPRSKLSPTTLATTKRVVAPLAASTDEAKPPVISKKPFVKSFTTHPRPGDRFEGKVFGIENGIVSIEIPGLDPDVDAYAILHRTDNLLLGKCKVGQIVTCEVVSTKEIKAGYWQVTCRLG